MRCSFCWRSISVWVVSIVVSFAVGVLRVAGVELGEDLALLVCQFGCVACDCVDCALHGVAGELCVAGCQFVLSQLCGFVGVAHVLGGGADCCDEVHLLDPPCCLLACMFSLTRTCPGRKRACVGSFSTCPGRERWLRRSSWRRLGSLQRCGRLRCRRSRGSGGRSWRSGSAGCARPSVQLRRPCGSYRHP